MTSHECASFLVQSATEQRKLMTSVLEETTWKAGRLETSLLEPFENMRRSNQANLNQPNYLQPENELISNWLPG